MKPFPSVKYRIALETCLIIATSEDPTDLTKGLIPSASLMASKNELDVRAKNRTSEYPKIEIEKCCR